MAIWMHRFAKLLGGGGGGRGGSGGAGVGSSMESDYRYTDNISTHCFLPIGNIKPA